MDNAAGHFPAFEKDNIIKWRFFHPTTLDGNSLVIWALLQRKKRNKYLYFKDVLDFYELNKNLKAHKKNKRKDFLEEQQV